MFYISLILTVLLYPFVVVGSCLCLLIIIILSTDGYHQPNPFVSPNTVYRAIRNTLTNWVCGLSQWYKNEKDK